MQEKIIEHQVPFIEVTSSEKVESKPDIICLYIRLSSKEHSYEKSKSVLNEMFISLKKNMVDAGIKANDIYTSDLTYYTYKDSNKNLVNSASQTITTKFDVDLKILNNLLDKISGNLAPNSIDINFEVKNKKVLYDKALKKAIKSAQKKAEFIANQVGAKVGRVLYLTENIYDCDSRRVYSRASMNNEDNNVLDANFKNLTFNSNVKVEFELLYN